MRHRGGLDYSGGDLVHRGTGDRDCARRRGRSRRLGGGCRPLVGSCRLSALPLLLVVLVRRGGGAAAVVVVAVVHRLPPRQLEARMRAAALGVVRVVFFAAAVAGGCRRCASCPYSGGPRPCLALGVVAPIVVDVVVVVVYVVLVAAPPYRGRLLGGGVCRGCGRRARALLGCWPELPLRRILQLRHIRDNGRGDRGGGDRRLPLARGRTEQTGGGLRWA